MSDLLPIHGFVLAGGRSSRMGQDKAMLPFCGVPLVEIAAAKLQAFCTDVSILGNRDDLGEYASVIHDLRRGIGPGAAFEAALHATKHDWALLVPVDVPLVPVEILRAWAVDIIGSVCGTSLLTVGQESQPAFSMLHKRCVASITAALDRGDRRLNDLLYAADRDNVLPVCARSLREYAAQATDAQLELWFSNMNTPQELADAEARAQAEGWRPPALF